jgi:hypothetical protein
MAMKIVIEECLKCGACVMVCKKEAILEETDSSGEVVYKILADKCTECKEEKDGSLCKAECPVPECIVKA